MSPSPRIVCRAFRAPSFLAIAACLPAAPLMAQDEPSAGGNGALRVFFDCEGGRGVCDFDFYRREIPYVNYTRDREDAQVHVLLTSEGTGSGGQRFTLDFIGREEFVEVTDRLEVVTRANLAVEQRLTDVARTLELGLLRYIARTAQASSIDIHYDGEEHGEIAARPEDDPWNFWTFRLRGDAELDVDERTESYELSGEFSADRVTDALKLEFSIGGSYNERVFETTDTTSVTSVRESYDAEGLSVWSLSDHWSVGAAYEAGHSSFENEDLQVRVGPALEYNIFPYSESTRRQFNFLYTVGVRYNDYIEQTVFLKDAETLPHHRFSVRLSVRQPWGESYGFLTFSQFLHDPSKNRFTAFVGADFRIFRGLSLSLNANYSRIRDQLNVPAGDATAEEVLLRQRVLQSGFRYGVSVGFSYRFGSIYSNVVNPRLDRF
ncbi:hypothetical protein [Candidatus Palauibacter sp.]|uniref:hypothetical protein n=1 Tax=Candidatus Palauibacter sp. TaxID=3101350 RepID=UPI003B59049F